MSASTRSTSQLSAFCLLTQPALVQTPQGAALDIGVSVTGGVAVPIYLRVDQGAHPFGTYTDIKLVVPDLLQSAI